MAMQLSASEAQFCEEVRSFVRANLPDSLAEKVRNDRVLQRADYDIWCHALARRGWLVNKWPQEYGGAGWTARQRYLFEKICGEMNCPWVLPFGPVMIGPIIYEFGNAEQKQRFLEPIRQQTVWWCQGYSEPQAGSDLASINTRAADGGDHYLLNGQKIWTSYAHYADWMFCLVRTDSEGSKQHGISFLLIDMTTPGIEVRPIITLDGSHTLNEVFFTDVRVPKENRIGEEGKGWTYAKWLLKHERIDVASLGMAQHALKKLRTIAGSLSADGKPLIEDRVFRAKIAQVEIQCIGIEQILVEVLEEADRLGTAGPSVSILKIRGTEVLQRINELTVEALAYSALPYQHALMYERDAEPPVGPDFAAPATPWYFKTRAFSILGGSNEIQKNILTKELLGL